MIDLTTEKLCDSLKIDFLTMTVHNIEPKKLLEILCKHSNVEFDKFNLSNRGSIPGYNKSYKFMDSNIITINWHDEFVGQAVCLNMTGRGCQFIDNDFLKKINEDLKDFRHSVTRIDIAVDDFNGSLIDNDIFSKTIKEFMKDNSNVSTNTKVRSVKHYTVADGMGNTADNIEFGNRGSSFMFRLYDKRIEQKKLELAHWKRFEIQLRHNRAQKSYEMLLSGITLNEVFTSQMYTCFKPLDEATNHWSFNSKSGRELASWYKSFLDKISKLYLKCII